MASVNGTTVRGAIDGSTVRGAVRGTEVDGGHLFAVNGDLLGGKVNAAR